jgi:hypothetical protein
MKSGCYTIERVENTWVALANGSKILSFDNEQIAIAAIKDATISLTAATRSEGTQSSLSFAPTT